MSAEGQIIQQWPSENVNKHDYWSRQHSWYVIARVFHHVPCATLGTGRHVSACTWKNTSLYELKTTLITKAMSYVFCSVGSRLIFQTEHHFLRPNVKRRIQELFIDIPNPLVIMMMIIIIEHTDYWRNDNWQQQIKVFGGKLPQCHLTARNLVRAEMVTFD